MKIYDMKRVAIFCMLIFLFFFGKTNAQNLPKDGLIAWFPFNGTLKDESGNGLNTFFADNNKGGISLSEVNNLTDDRKGKAKSAFYFSGPYENNAIKVTLAKSLNLLDRTVALWVKNPSKSITHYSNIFELGYNSEVKQYCSILGDESSYVSQRRVGKISCLIAEGGFVESRSYLNDDNWHHLAVVVNSLNNSYKIYIDGKLDSDSYLPIPIINYSNPYTSNPQKQISEIPVNYLVFGNVFRNDPSCAFGGKIDDIGIWNRALNESEIFQLFDNYYTTNSKSNIRTDSRIKQFGQNTIDNVNSNTNASTLNKSANSINNENDLTPQNGQGTYTFSNGDKYVGEFRDGKKNGQGTYIFSNGEKYVGEFRNDWRNGQGTYTFPNGDKYVGEWRDDKKNGQGTYTFNNGIIQEGAYENGLYIGEDQKKRNNLSVLRFTSYDCGELVKSINLKGKNPRYNNQPKLYADEVIGLTIGEYVIQHYSNATESEIKSLINQASECVTNSLNNGEKKAAVVQNNQKNVASEKNDELSEAAFYSILAAAFEYGNKQIASKSPFESKTSSSNFKQSTSTSEKKCTYCWKRQKQIRRFDLAKDIYVWDRGDAEMRPGSVLCTDQCGGSGKIVEGAFSSKSLRVCYTCKGSGWIKCNYCKGTGFVK